MQNVQNFRQVCSAASDEMHPEHTGRQTDRQTDKQQTLYHPINMGEIITDSYRGVGDFLSSSLSLSFFDKFLDTNGLQQQHPHLQNTFGLKYTDKRCIIL